MKKTYYIIKLEEGIYLKYVGGYHVNSTLSLEKAKFYLTLKTAVNARDKVLALEKARPYLYQHPNIKILKLEMEVKEIDA